MPLYEYNCPQCGAFDIIQKFSDKPLKKCPKCKRPVKKLLPTRGSFRLYGKGWFKPNKA